MGINNLKKFIIIVFIIIISILSAWSANKNHPTEVSILMPAPFSDSTEGLIEKFNQKELGKIHISVTKGPRETESVSDLAISSLLLGNSPFDIILIDVTWLPKYAEAGWLANMEPWIDLNKWNSLSSGAKLGNEYNNNIYRWPLNADIGLLYWRKDLMKNPPRTPEELINTSIRLKENGDVSYGYVWQGRQYEGLSCVYLEVLNGFGGEWINTNKEVKLSTKEAINASRWMKTLILTGASPKSVTNFTENEALQLFVSGDAALMRNWPYAWAELQKDTSAVKDKVAVTTMVSQREEDRISTLGSWGLSIMQSSPNKDAAYKVIDYLTSDESQKELFLKYGYTPTSSNLYNDKSLLAIAPILEDINKGLSITKPRPQSPLYAQISDVLQSELSSILTGQKSVENAMNIAQFKTDNILSSAGER